MHGMEVDLIAEPSVCALKVSFELMTHLFPRVQRPWGQVHEPRLGCASEGHREIVGHDDLIPSYSEDGGGVDL
jgi:hypothetical protein